MYWIWYTFCGPRSSKNCNYKTGLYPENWNGSTSRPRELKISSRLDFCFHLIWLQNKKCELLVFLLPPKFWHFLDIRPLTFKKVEVMEARNFFAVLEARTFPMNLVTWAFSPRLTQILPLENQDEQNCNKKYNAHFRSRTKYALLLLFWVV